MNAIMQYDERAVMTRVAKGDEDAFGDLFHQYRHRVTFFALKFLQSDAKAEDILQEVFLKVWLNREHLPKVRSFKAWLDTIARNQIFNSLRKLAAEEALLAEITSKAEIADQQDILNYLSLHELETSLEKAVSSLTPQQKKVFELSRVEGLKQRQIADRLEISTDTVKKHMTDALRKVRLHMKSSEHLVHLSILLLTVKF
jgi:RNA polymerase sigma-70 factor (ECF subfamily)